MTAFQPDELARAPARWSTPQQIRFQDVDAAGVVFFPRFFEYFHDAFLRYLDERGCPLAEALAARRWGSPLRHVEADYFAPLRFGDVVVVEIVGIKVRGTDVNVGYRIARAGAAVAVGQTRHVFVELASFRRMPALPDDVRTAIAPLVLEETV